MNTKINSCKKFLLTLILPGLMFFSCSDDDAKKAEETFNVKLSTNATLGEILTDESGKTLYFFTKDVAGNSACEGGCLTSWPVFYSETIKPAAGLDGSDFKTITRSDGTTKQTTYKGWPLYYFANDAAVGDVKGEKVNNVWFVAKPDYTLFMGNVSANYLTDISGKTLYYFSNDTQPDASNCNGGCVTNWPLFNKDTFVVPSSLNKADFKVFTRGDGNRQVSYKGKPLYYFVNDANRGETKGTAIANWPLATP